MQEIFDNGNTNSYDEYKSLKDNWYSDRSDSVQHEHVSETSHSNYCEQKSTGYVVLSTWSVPESAPF